MFKNLTVYRIGADWSATLAQVEECLSKSRFVACGLTQPRSAGWVEPRGEVHGPLVEAIGGQWLLKLQTEQRVLPAAVVKRRVEERSQQIEQSSGRKPGKKQLREIKEQATLELLPMAFTKQATINVWLDPQRRLLMVDASSPARAAEVAELLIKCLDGLSLAPLQTAQSAAAAMSAWLASGEPPPAFSVDRECELKSADEMKSVVRYARHPLDTDEVRQHIDMGKQPTRLAMSWQGRVSFMLTDAMQIKKLDFLDVVFEGRKGSQQHQDEAFDADAAIGTGELARLIPDLIEALGGEQMAA